MRRDRSAPATARIAVVLLFGMGGGCARHTPLSAPGASDHVSAALAMQAQPAREPVQPAPADSPPLVRRPATAPVTIPATRAVFVEEEPVVVYDQGEPRYPGRYFAGGRGGGGGGGGGGPSNGIPGYGPYGRFRIGGPLLVGLSLDFGEYEFSDIGDHIDVDPLTGRDIEIDSTSVTAWVEYEFHPPARNGLLARFRPFEGAGVGVGFLDDDRVAGTTVAGGTYDFDVEGDAEAIPGVVAGIRIDLLEQIVLELGARYDYHISDIEVTDNVTGRSDDVGEYSTYGGYVGLQFRW